MRDCVVCGGRVTSDYRYCPWCSAPLRLKLVEFFRPHELIVEGEQKALRVSRYLDPTPAAHVRFSIWIESGDGARAEAAVSLDEQEAARLAAFLRSEGERPRSSVRRRLEELLLRQG